MHGILYVDENGDAVSNLYTWQDFRGNSIYKDEKTYAQYINEQTGYSVATGFGLVSHFINQTNAHKLCTIGDYVAMKLANAKEPITHITNAASLGLFDLKNQCFDINAIKKIGIDTNILPQVTAEYINYPNSNISVCIGDNQASFIGSVSDMHESLLVNVGTGSQISYLTKEYRTCETLETRPFDKDSYLLVGSSLCGGRAFAILHDFFKSTAQYFDNEDVDIYEIMKKMANNIDLSAPKLTACTKFSGTRSNFFERGSISNIDTQNFTPENFVVSILEGISSELFDMYDNEPKSLLIGSGNGIRKNKMLCDIMSNKQNLPLSIPAHNEEASYGAAIFSMVANGVYSDVTTAQKLIKFN